MFLKNQDLGGTAGTSDVKGLSSKLLFFFFNPSVLFLALAKFSMEDHQISTVYLAMRYHLRT